MLFKYQEFSKHSRKEPSLETKLLMLCFAFLWNFLLYLSSLLEISIIYRAVFLEKSIGQNRIYTTWGHCNTISLHLKEKYKRVVFEMVLVFSSSYDYYQLLKQVYHWNEWK